MKSLPQGFKKIVSNICSIALLALKNFRQTKFHDTFMNIVSL